MKSFRAIGIAYCGICTVFALVWGLVAYETWQGLNGSTAFAATFACLAAGIRTAVEGWREALRDGG